MGMLDETQVKLLQQRQKIKMFYGTPAQITEIVNQWIENTPVYVVDQKIEVIDHTVLVSVLYVSSMKPTASTAQQALPSTKGQQPVLNMGAIKAAYEQG
jgi:hypothetical protein